MLLMDFVSEARTEIMRAVLKDEGL